MLLEEATLEMTAGAFSNTSEADKKLHVLFYTDALPDAVQSNASGRAIFREAEFVMIMVPGDKNSIVRRPVQERDKQRFPEKYAAFQSGREQEVVYGTPLRMVGWLTKAQIKEFEYLGCHTLEQLASMPDSTAQKFLGLQGWKQRAKDAIQASKEAAPLLALRTEVEKKDNELEVLRRQLAEQAAQLAQLQNAVMNSALNQTAPEVTRATRK